jgi:hypothetical protein
MRRPSRLTRAIGCFTALLTVWCLGCSAFDVLLSSLLPNAGPTMVCASEGPVASGISQPMTERHSSAVMATTDQDGGNGTDCGCGSCHAPVPTQLAIVNPSPPVSAQPADPPRIVPDPPRAPLVPPPQRTA